MHAYIRQAPTQEECEVDLMRGGELYAVGRRRLHMDDISHKA